jgi:hypothetical protein
LSYIMDSEMPMAFRELYPIVVAAVLWSKYWIQNRIVFHKICHMLSFFRHSGESETCKLRLLTLVDKLIKYVTKLLPGITLAANWNVQEAVKVLVFLSSASYNFSQFVNSYMMDSQEQLHYSCNTTFIW